MLRDKILFVMKLQKLKKQVSFCHLSLRNEHIKMWKTHPNDYWVFSKMVDLLSLIPRSPTFQDGGWVKFPTLGKFRMSNSLLACTSLSLIPVGCRPPPLSWGKPLIGALFCLLLVTSTIILLITIYRWNIKNRLGPCGMYYVFCRLLSTTHVRKLVYQLRKNATEW